MKELPTLTYLTMEDKDALIMELWAEIQRLRQEITEQKTSKKDLRELKHPAIGGKEREYRVQ